MRRLKGVEIKDGGGQGECTKNGGGRKSKGRQESGGPGGGGKVPPALKGQTKEVNKKTPVCRSTAPATLQGLGTITRRRMEQRKKNDFFSHRQGTPP